MLVSQPSSTMPLQSLNWGDMQNALHLPPVQLDPSMSG
jgi:hypothetical protein